MAKLIRRKMSNKDYMLIRLFIETGSFEHTLSDKFNESFLNEEEMFSVSVPDDKKTEIIKFLNEAKTKKVADDLFAKMLAKQQLKMSRYTENQTQPLPQIASQPTPQSAPVEEKDEKETKEEREAKIKEILADL